MSVSYPQKAIDLLTSHLTQEEKKDPATYGVYVVWFCYILGGWKALLSTTEEDGKYYEITHNKDTLETYIDVYIKSHQAVVSGE